MLMKPLIIAHRGASVEAPENTLAAFKRALEIGVDAIEMDLHITKDSVPVVIHDSSLERTTNCTDGRCVEELTLSELKGLDAGSRFSTAYANEQIPTLEEVLLLDRGDTMLMLEIKDGTKNIERLMSSILSVLPKDDPSIILGSFEPDIIKALQNTPYSLIGIVEEESFAHLFLEMGIKHLALWSKIIGPRLLQDIANKHLQTSVWVFTVDDIEDARFLKSINIDGIITNDPRKIGVGLRLKQKQNFETRSV